MSTTIKEEGLKKLRSEYKALKVWERKAFSTGTSWEKNWPEAEGYLDDHLNRKREWEARIEGMIEILDISFEEWGQLKREIRKEVRKEYPHLF